MNAKAPRRTAALAVGIIALLALIALGVRLATVRPFSLAQRDSILIFLGSQCAFSQRTFRNLKVMPPLALDRPRILPIPVDADAAVSVCPAALKLLRAESILLRLLPDAIACDRLLEDAQAFHTTHFTALPAYALGDTPIPSHAATTVFKVLGISYELDDAGGAVFTLPKPHPQTDPATPPVSLSEQFKQKDAIVTSVGI